MLKCPQHFRRICFFFVAVCFFLFWPNMWMWNRLCLHLLFFAFTIIYFRISVIQPVDCRCTKEWKVNGSRFVDFECKTTKQLAFVRCTGHVDHCSHWTTTTTQYTHVCFLRRKVSKRAWSENENEKVKSNIEPVRKSLHCVSTKLRNSFRSSIDRVPPCRVLSYGSAHNSLLPQTKT